jgi:hypothetical protein
LDSSNGGFGFTSDTAASRPSRVVTVTVPYDINSTTCDYLTWGTAANAEAVAAFGLDPLDYTFK